MNSIVNRDELRRLEKAARDKNKTKLADWIKRFEDYMTSMLKRDFVEACQEEVVKNFDTIIMAVAYTVYFSEETYIDKTNMNEFMNDLYVTIDLFRTGEYKPIDYEKTLNTEGVYIEHYDSDLIYKKYLDILDTDLVRFLKSKPSKIVTVCGSIKYKEEILKINTELSLQNYIVFLDSVLTEELNNTIHSEERPLLLELMKDKIKMSDTIYVVNKDGYIDDKTKAEIEYAKEHNKEIIYMEEMI